MTPNRPTVRVEGLDPTASPVILDVAALLAGSDVSLNTEGSAPGCMAAPSDPECPPVLERLGLGSGPQVAFVVE